MCACRQEYRKAYALLEQMRQRVPGVVITDHITAEVSCMLCRCWMGVPRIVSHLRAPRQVLEELQSRLGIPIATDSQVVRCAPA